MEKIPTLFVRDPADPRNLTREVNPGCEWVLAGEGVATRKYDGTAVMFDGTSWWARREVKPGKSEPPNFRAVEHDENTGKTFGWEPADQSGFAKFINEAVAGVDRWEPGTYELVGPKIQGNPEDYSEHTVVRHGVTPLDNAPRDFDSLRDFLTSLRFEGIVWHHDDGRMCKLKKRDFPANA